LAKKIASPAPVHSFISASDYIESLVHLRILIGAGGENNCIAGASPQFYKRQRIIF